MTINHTENVGFWHFAHSFVRGNWSSPVKRWPMSVVCDVEDGDYVASLTRALATGPYGKCVYECDNDVCDSQMVNIQFKGGAIANLTMTAFTKEICERYTRITGSKG